MKKQPRKYAIKEMFYSLQGEGARAGTPTMFLRFAGCNLWSGNREKRVGAGGCAEWCDTDFVGGKKMTAEKIVHEMISIAPECRRVVLTGGEPMLQLDKELFRELRRHHYYIALETNGTIEVPRFEEHCDDRVDWITVSPKPGLCIVQKNGNELKVIFGQPAYAAPFFEMEQWQFDHYYVQPIDRGPDKEGLNKFWRQNAVDWCLKHPKWKLSLQTHKILELR